MHEGAGRKDLEGPNSLPGYGVTKSKLNLNGTLFKWRPTPATIEFHVL